MFNLHFIFIKVLLSSILLFVIELQAAPTFSKEQIKRNIVNDQLFNETVAIVNNQVITRNELDLEVFQLKKQFQEQSIITPSLNILYQEVLQQIINQLILLQTAKSQNINVSNEEVRNVIDQKFSSQNPDLKEYSIDFENYCNKVKKQLIINKLQQSAIAGKIYIPPIRIEEYISKLKKKDTLYLVQNILLPYNANKFEKHKIYIKANNILQQIQSDKITFTDAAKKYSKSLNASLGGILEWRKLTELPEIYRDKIKKMNSGQISTPFIANNSIQIIKLIDTKANKNSLQFINEYKIRKL